MARDFKKLLVGVIALLLGAYLIVSGWTRLSSGGSENSVLLLVFLSIVAIALVFKRVVKKFKP